MASVEIKDEGPQIFAELTGFTGTPQYRHVLSDGSAGPDGWQDVIYSVRNDQEWSRSRRVQWRDQGGSGNGQPFPWPYFNFFVDKTKNPDGTNRIFNNVGCAIRNPIGTALKGALAAGEEYTFRVIPYAGSDVIQWYAYKYGRTTFGESWGVLRQVSIGGEERANYTAPRPSQMGQLDQREIIRVDVTDGQNLYQAFNEVWLHYPKPTAIRRRAFAIGSPVFDNQNEISWTFDEPLPQLTGLTGRYPDPDNAGQTLPLETAYLKRVELWTTGLVPKLSGRDGYNALPVDGRARLDISPNADGSNPGVIFDDRNHLGFSVINDQDYSQYINWGARNSAGFLIAAWPDPSHSGNFYSDVLDWNVNIKDGKTQQLWRMIENNKRNPNIGYQFLYWNQAIPGSLVDPFKGRANIGSPQTASSTQVDFQRATEVEIGRIGPNGIKGFLRNLTIENSTITMDIVDDGYRPTHVITNPVGPNTNHATGLDTGAKGTLDRQSTFQFRLTQSGFRARTIVWPMANATHSDIANGRRYVVDLSGDANQVLRESIVSFFANAATNQSYILSWRKDGYPPILSPGYQPWFGNDRVGRMWIGEVGERPAEEIDQLWKVNEDGSHNLIFQRQTD